MLCEEEELKQRREWHTVIARLKKPKHNNQVLLPAACALSNLCLQPGGISQAGWYLCSSAIVSVLFLALFPQLAGLRTSAFYGRAGEAEDAAARPQLTRAHSRPPDGRHSSRERESGVGERGYI